VAIFITQARFATDRSPETTAAREDRARAAARLVAQAEGKLIACYLTSGHYDILLIFEGPSHDKVEAALAVAAAGNGFADLKTVKMLATGETKSAAAGQAATTSSNPSTGAPARGPDASTSEVQKGAEADAKAAAAILKAQQDAVENIQAGRPASYYFASPPVVPAPSQAAPAPRATKREGASKKGESLQSHTEQDDGKSV
jgi:uncharacterized protein with GYD domain